MTFRRVPSLKHATQALRGLGWHVVHTTHTAVPLCSLPELRVELTCHRQPGSPPMTCCLWPGFSQYPETAQRRQGTWRFHQQKLQLRRPPLQSPAGPERPWIRRRPAGCGSHTPQLCAPGTAVLEGLHDVQHTCWCMVSCHGGSDASEMVINAVCTASRVSKEFAEPNRVLAWTVWDVQCSADCS